MNDRQKMIDAQVQEELVKLGVAGVPLDEVPDEILEEATAAAKKIVGEQ